MLLSTSWDLDREIAKEKFYAAKPPIKIWG